MNHIQTIIVVTVLNALVINVVSTKSINHNTTLIMIYVHTYICIS